MFFPEVLLAKSKGQKRTKSSESEIEENSSEDSCDDVNDEDFYVKKASQKGRTKKVYKCVPVLNIKFISSHFASSNVLAV
ncbi:hypothetical protein EON65_23830 [archaeon]|nr:MAG: hypothetical protein EON65_23830 [archaeon]